MEQVPCLVGVACLDDREAGILQHLDGVHPNEVVVLDHEDDGCFRGTLHRHGVSTGKAGIGCRLGHRLRNRRIEPLEAYGANLDGGADRPHMGSYPGTGAPLF